MQELFLGEAMKQRRLELGLTQEQLCEGICEPMTISRLENGKQTPSRRNLNALLGRLSMPTDRYYALLSQKEEEVEALWNQITICNVKFTQAAAENRPAIRNECLALHQKLRSISDENDPITQQFLIRSQLLLGNEEGAYTPEEQIRMLTDAIHLTHTRFDIHEIGQGLYSTDEIKLINQLATAYILGGHHAQAIEILSQLYAYIKLHFSSATLTRAAAGMVCFNYANELYTTKQYPCAAALAEEGVELVRNCASTQSLPELIGLLAECYHFMGNDEKSRDLFYQAYYLMKTFRKEQNLRNLIADAKELLHMDLSHGLPGTES